jgi:DinB superfamily
VDPSTSALLVHLDRQHARLRDAVECVPPARRRDRPATDCWSVAEVLEHLALVETNIARMVERRLDADRAAAPAATDVEMLIVTLDRAVLDRSQRTAAPAFLQPHADRDPATAWAALEAASDRLRRAVIARDGLGPGGFTAPHPSLGPLNIHQWIAFAASHKARHADQIEEIGRVLGAA